MPSSKKHLIQSVTLFLLIALAIVPPAFASGPLIPVALNEILPRISAGMTEKQVKTVLAEKYPAVKAVQGMWSGQSGYMDFVLDERYKLSVSAARLAGLAGTAQSSDDVAVNEDFIIYIFDQPAKQRIEIKQYHWQ